MSRPVFVVVTYPDAEAADAARIEAVEVYSECSAPLDDPCLVVYRVEVDGPRAVEPLGEEDFA